ncbi:hypothetical protein [Neisseria sp.]|uniref:hypothetical protein n=1 Tax=Neisseria sp. TaxID=192066 RepID=UPI0035A143D8
MPGYPQDILQNRSVVKHGNYAVMARYCITGSDGRQTAGRYIFIGYLNDFILFGLFQKLT